MGKFLVFILMALVPMIGLSQKTSKYDGPFVNGQKTPGHASYTYLVDASGKQVKHGSFRYSVKVKEEDYRVNHSFSGNYKQGLKNDQWNYQVNTKDYPKDDQGYYYTTTMLLTANYVAGMPNGKWTYSIFEQRRKKVIENNKYEWTDYEDVKDVKISIKFKNGIIIDTLTIVDKFGYSITTISNDAGFLVDSFLVNSASKNMEFVFSDGFLTRELTKEGKWNSYLHHDYYLKNKALEGKAYTLKSLSYFDENGCLIKKYLDENIFNANIFIFRYIDGDKIIRWDNSKISFTVDYKGLYHREMESSLNKNEEFKIQGIYKSKTNIERIYNDLNSQVKNSTNKEEMISRRDKVGLLLEKLKSMACLANSSKSEFMIDELKRISEANCKYSFPQKPQIKTREELLNILYIEAQKIEAEAEKV